MTFFYIVFSFFKFLFKKNTIRKNIKNIDIPTVKRTINNKETIKESNAAKSQKF